LWSHEDKQTNSEACKKDWKHAGLKGYFFTDEELAAYKTALCREQRIMCYNEIENEDEPLMDVVNAIKELVLYAPEPE